VANQVEIIKSVKATERTLELLADQGMDGATREDLLSDVYVILQPNSDEIAIRYANTDPEVAIATVNGVLQAYIETTAQQSETSALEALDRIDAEIEVLDIRLADVDGQITDLSSDEILDSLAESAMDALVEISSLERRLASTTNPDVQESLLRQLGEMRARVDLFLSARSSSAANPQIATLSAFQDRLINRRATLVEQRDQILIDTALTPGVVTFEDPAVFTTPVTGFSPMRAIAAGLILGLIAGTWLATTIQGRRDEVISGRQQAAEILQAPLLASVPDFKLEHLDSNIPIRDFPMSAAAESFRFALSSLETALTRVQGRVVLFASPSIGQGKTTVVANIALSAAMERSRVLAVDADFGGQRLTDIFDEASVRESAWGLTDIISNRVSIDEALWNPPSEFASDLYLLSRGNQVRLPSEVLQTTRARELFAKFSDHFDLVLVDSPALLRVAYASSLLRLVDSVVAVIPSNITIRQVKDFKDRCDFMNKPIAGFVYTRDSSGVDGGKIEDSAMGIFDQASLEKSRSVS
jgi:tyrosine-protein kinase Etk/Wzc